MFLPDDNSDMAGARITFEPGSRTSGHSRLAEQFLIIASGMG